MKKIIYSIIFSLSCLVCRGQNLIVNGDFENDSSCHSAYDWTSPSLGSPDYFNACSSFANSGVPSNFAGYENAHSGHGYEGLIIKNSGLISVEWREYIQQQLAETLDIGKTYHLQMYISLADNQPLGSDAIGALFSTTPVSRADHFRFTEIPQVVNQSGNFIANYAGWVLVKMQFVADSAYSYITIGNFFDDANTASVVLGSGGMPRAYFFIDDICLTTDSVTCYPSTGINDTETNKEFLPYPNPFTSKLIVNFKNNKDSEVCLYDISGRTILRQSFRNSIELNTESISKGIYIYELRSNTETLSKGKIVKE